MNKQVRNLLDFETPFTVIDFGGDIEIRQYWTKGGVYGPQVVTVIFNYPEDVWHCKTSGCGYCKQSSGLSSAFKHLGIRPKSMRLGGEKMPREYHIGGNFYRVPKSKIRKVK